MNYYLTLLALFTSSFCWAQTDQQRINDLDQVAKGGHQQMFGKSLPPPGLAGSTLYSDDWYSGDITFNSGRVYKDLLIRYDIASGIIETKKHDKTVAFNAEDIQGFTWFNKYSKSNNIFVNCKNFAISAAPLVGFFEVIVDSEVALLSHPVISIKKPNYVVGLDVGHREYRVKKVEDLYFAIDERLYKIKKSKGKNLGALKDRYPGIEEFVDQNNLTFKDRSDLITITHYLNSLSAPNGYQ